MDLKDNQGVLFKNDKYVEGGKFPMYRGEQNVGGKLYNIAIWVRSSKNGNKYLSTQISEKLNSQNSQGNAQVQNTQPQQPNAYQQQTTYAGLDDEIPWN